MELQVLFPKAWQVQPHIPYERKQRRTEMSVRCLNPSGAVLLPLAWAEGPPAGVEVEREQREVRRKGLDLANLRVRNVPLSIGPHGESHSFKPSESQTNMKSLTSLYSSH